MNPLDLAIISAAITAITTRQDCQSVIDDLATKKENASFLALSEERKLERIGNLSATINSDFASATAEKASYQTVIPTLPAGNPVRKNLEEKVVGLDYKLFTLNQRKEKIGQGAFIALKLKYVSLLADVDNHSEIITVLTAHLATLPTV